MAVNFYIGDRVVVNESCPNQEMRGMKGFVAGLHFTYETCLIVFVSYVWPSRNEIHSFNPSYLDNVGSNDDISR